MWRDDDQDAALAYIEWLARDNAERCPNCGTKDTDWMGPHPVTGKLVDLREPAYRAVVRHCSGCEELEDLDGERDKRPGDRITLAPNLGDTDVDDERDDADASGTDE